MSSIRSRAAMRPPFLAATATPSAALRALSIAHDGRAPEPQARRARTVRAALSTALVVGVAGLGTSDVEASAPAIEAALPWLFVVAGGLLSGFLAGLLGIGGALVTIPVFYAVLPQLGVGPEQLPAAVIGSSLLTMVPTTIAAACRQRRHGALDLAWVRRLAPAMAVGAVAGALLASQVQGPVLNWLFAAQSLYYGLRLLLDRADDGRASRTGLTARICRLPTWLAGTGMAGFVAAVGMGGGSVVAPFLRHRGLALRQAVATASALNLCIAFGGSCSFLVAGLSQPAAIGTHHGAALLMGAVAVLAVPAGVALAHRLPMAWFRDCIGATNVVAATALAVQLATR